MLKLIQHQVISEDGAIPDVQGALYSYVLAGNGVFVRATRDGLDAVIPIASFQIAGLPNVTPYVHIPERVPAPFLCQALWLSRQALPNEALFWFNHKTVWQMNVPDQVAHRGRVVPSDVLDPLGTNALIDLHSHGALDPFFSTADNHDEQGFRIYAVIGTVDGKPSLLVRVGVYGHYFDIPASTIFEMPENVADAFLAWEEENQDETE